MNSTCIIEKYYVYLYALINKSKYHDNPLNHKTAWSEQHNQDMM